MSCLQYTYNLKVRNANIEAFIHVSMPHDPDIGDKERTKITLKEGKIQEQSQVSDSDVASFQLRKQSECINLHSQILRFCDYLKLETQT